MLQTLVSLPLAAAKPTGGAALDQILIANAMAIAASGVLLWLVLGHRSGRHQHLARIAAWTEDKAGLPGWAALPSVVATASLLVAVFGMYWDIALHIDIGRDAGPLANPAHYLILGGLFGIFCAGFIAMALPREKPGPTAVRITEGWYAPLGGVLITSCAAFALLGFPLDDFWHRLFGQDVTLWGPTHLMLIGGAGLTLLGQAVLLVEGMRARGPAAPDEGLTQIVRLRRVAIIGALLIGLSTFQAEFDFGVPQYQMIFQPLLIALAASIALVVGRLWIGPGGALGAVGFFLIVRGTLSLLVGPVFGETTPSLPLYIVEGLCVELLALRLADRPLALGLASGIAIGTVGFAAEYVWAQELMRTPWNENLLPSGPLLATVAGIAGGLVGALIATALRGELPRPAVARGVAWGSLAAIALLVINGLVTTVPADTSATVKLRDASPAPERRVSARVEIDPPSAAEDAKWLNITSWQGGGLVVNELRRVESGLYRTTEPIPVYPDWKATLRMQPGRSVIAAPVYLPADPAIPAPGVNAPAQFRREFISDKELLQREVKQDVPGWLTTLATLVVLAIALSLVTILALGLGRIGRSESGGERPGPRLKSTALADRTRPA